MKKLFDLDNPVMQFLSTLADLIILNLLTLLCCIPIFTIGASLSAMHYVLLKIARKEDSYIVKPFFKAFRDNFKQATVEWLILLVIYFILPVDILMIHSNQDLFPKFMLPLMIAVLIIVFFLTQWVFPLQMHFVNPVKTTMKNALLFALAKFPRTLGMAAIWAVPVLMLLFTTSLVPFVFMLGLSVPGLVMAYLYSPVFKKFEPEEETVDGDFAVSDEEKDEAYQDIADIQAENARIERELREGTFRSESEKAQDAAEENDKVNNSGEETGTPQIAETDDQNLQKDQKETSENDEKA